MAKSKIVIYLIIVTIHLLSTTLSQANQQFSDGSRTNTSCLVDTDCPIWAECNNTKCVCKEMLQNHRTVHCSEELQLSVIRCHCVTYDNRTDELTEGSCFQNCENNNNKNEYLPLPKDVSQLNQFMCEERWNRTGRLCGRCLPGHSPLAYSYDMRCVKCPEGNKNIWKYVLVAFGPLTVFYMIVLFCRIKVKSKHFHGYLIASQILSAPVFVRTVYLYLEHHSKLQVYIVVGTMYSMWNLDFFRGLYPDICLNVSTFTVLALDYAVAIYPLLLTVVSYILIELHARNFKLAIILWKPFRYLLQPILRDRNSRRTVIDAFATFFQLSFVKMASVSVDLLTPVRAYKLNTNSSAATWVLYYDTTIEYFGEEHLPSAMLALLFLSLFVLLPILLLIVYQFRWFQRLLSCLKLRHQLLQEIMESFQSCYKNGIEPGTKDHRWFAAVPMVGRYTLLVVFALILEPTYFLFAIAIIILVMILITIVEPYKKQFSNHARTDIVFWGILAIFFGFNESTMYNSLRPAELLRSSQVIRVIVAAFPLLYMVCVICFLILSKIRKKRILIGRIRAWRRGYVNIERDSEASLPDRMVNPENYIKEVSLVDPDTY